MATYTATDPEGAMVMWSLEGDDAGDFMIENGVLSFKKSPDFEMPMGGSADDSNTYEVMVKATDETMKVGMKTVMVEVTNVDEAGMVTLSARRPQSATAFTAKVTDPDTGVANKKWQWAKASSKNDSYSNIANATSATYTPTDADLGSYLRATVTYEDDESEGKSAMMKSELPVQAVRGSNNAPEFAADQDPIMDGVQPDAKREVAENTEAGKTVGSPLTATDDDGDTLTYTLTDVGGGTDGDSAVFTIDWATGQIMTKADLDYEDSDNPDNEYTVVVRATDPAGIPGAGTPVTADSDTVTVVISVTDKNEAPVVSGDATHTFNEDSGVITTPLQTYTAVDPDTGAPDPTWTVGGADGSKFTADDGALEFKAKPNYEMPTDANMDNVYEVTVQASDGKLTGMKKVMVTVGNAEEAGVVTLNKVQPRVGIPVTAMLKDPDGSISKLTWQWSISGAAGLPDATPTIPGTADGAITDATSDTYTPKAGDVGGTLTATASYFDGESAADATTKKTAPKAADNDVAEDTRNQPPMFGDEDLDMDGVQNTMAMRNVEENTEANAADDSASDVADDNVGSVVMATDPDPNSDALAYTLGGADEAKFRVRDNGQIEVAAGTMLDYETKTTYMVTVMAEDSFGATASIMVTIMVTNVDEMPVIMRAPDANVAPEFASDTTSRTVAENTVAGEDIGDPVAASDANLDTLTYALSGTNAASFDIDMATGQLMTKMALDFETKPTYSVTVTASDSGGLSDSIDVTITVTDVMEQNRAPEFSDTTTARSVADGTAGGGEVGDPVTATDANGDTLAYMLSGADAGAFDIDSDGQITVAAGTTLDRATKDTYTVTVKATDPDGASDIIAVTITVTAGLPGDTNNDGMIDKPEVIAAFRAYVADSSDKIGMIAIFRQYVAAAARS